jgi:hypothetical protein
MGVKLRLSSEGDNTDNVSEDRELKGKQSASRRMEKLHHEKFHNSCSSLDINATKPTMRWTQHVERMER